MSTAVPPMPSETAPAGLSEPQRIIDTFIAPSKTFEDIRRNQSWWVPFLLSAIVATCFIVTVEKKVGWESVVRDLMSSNSRFQQAPPEQQEQTTRIMIKGYTYGGYATAIFILVFGLIEAVILMVIFNFGFDAGIPFKAALAIIFYAGLPNIIGGILAIVSIMLGSPENFNFQNPVATNPAYFMDRGSTSKFVYTFVSSFDVIAIWSIVLLGMGFAINSQRRKLKTGTAIVTVAVLFLIWKLGAASLAALRS